MNPINILVGVIVALGGALFFNISRRKSAEGVLANLDTKQKENTIDQGIAENQGLIQAKQKTIEEIEQEMEKKANDTDNANSNDNTDFFNNNLKK